MNKIDLHYTSKPQSNHVFIDKLLDEVSKEKNKLLSYFLDQYSLGNGQFQILNMIGWDEGISQDKLATQRNIDKSAIAKSVKKLIEHGYIYKERDEKDKRAFCLYCTEKGKEVIPKTRLILEKVEEILTAGASPEELAIFIKMTQRIHHNIETFMNQK